MKILTKFDILLIIFVVIIALYFNFYLSKTMKQPIENGNVVVYYKNEIYDTYDLSTNQQINININEGFNELEIKNGVVNMIDANCPDSYCVKDKPIEYNNQSIVCLPHQVLVKIENTEDSDIDSFVR